MKELAKKRKPQPLTNEEYKAFLDALGHISRREYYIVKMLYESEYTLSQILDFKVIDLKLFHVAGFDTPEFLMTAKCYVLEHFVRYVPEERVFKSRFGNRVPLSRIDYVFKKAIKLAAIDRPIGVLDIKATAKNQQELRIAQIRLELQKEADEIRRSVI